MDRNSPETALRRLERGQWPELYRLMVARRFPSVPPKYADALPHFKKADMYGVTNGSELEVAFVFGEPDDGIAFFDVVCRANRQGVWATPTVLRELFRLAFVARRLRCVWVQTHSKKALKAALAAGFVPATPLDAAEPVLVMTPGTLPRRYQTIFNERSN